MDLKWMGKPLADSVVRAEVLGMLDSCFSPERPLFVGRKVFDEAMKDPDLLARFDRIRLIEPIPMPLFPPPPVPPSPMPRPPEAVYVEAGGWTGAPASVTFVASGQLVAADIRWGLNPSRRPPGRVWGRLVVRMPFRDWSRAVDRDGLAGVRAWVESVERILGSPALRREAVASRPTEAPPSGHGGSAAD